MTTHIERINNNLLEYNLSYNDDKLKNILDLITKEFNSIIKNRKN